MFPNKKKILKCQNKTNEYKFLNKVSWYVHIVSEKAFCHSQISVISPQNILVTF